MLKKLLSRVVLEILKDAVAFGKWNGKIYVDHPDKEPVIHPDKGIIIFPEPSTHERLHKKVEELEKKLSALSMFLNIEYCADPQFIKKVDKCP